MLLQQTLIQTDIKPRTAEENAYLKLQARREILSDQLDRLSERRDDLARNVTDRQGADREGVEARIKLLDTQIQQTETDLASVTKEVATAATPSVADHVITRWRGFDDDDMVGAGFVGAGIMFALFIPLLVRVFRRRRWVPGGSTTTSSPAIGNERIERMEMAIDSIAVEMERVSENQRFMTRLMTETQLAGTLAAVRGSTEAAKAAAENSHG